MSLIGRQLLVMLELRCSEEYARFISQGVIDAYLKIFIDKVRDRSDINDLDFTDYEVINLTMMMIIEDIELEFSFLESNVQRNLLYVHWSLQTTY